MAVPRFRFSFLLWIVLSLGSFSVAAQPQAPAFRVVPLGVMGGLDESNLSAYLIAPVGSDQFICADAGTLHYGIAKAVKNKVLKGPVDSVLKNQVRGYLISHPHLDHLAGLVINSPEDAPKPIYGLPFVIDALRDKYFTWQSWANFANEGDEPALKKYNYVRLNEQEIALANTGMTMRPYLLSHSSPQSSTAFLIQYNTNSILYVGDTGADPLEHADQLKKLWQSVAPAIKTGSLKAIFIEVSFPNEQPDKQLFGHLTPNWFMTEMRVLCAITGLTALQKVPVVVTHLKPAGNNVNTIKTQLKAANTLGLQLVFPVQAKELLF